MNFNHWASITRLITEKTGHQPKQLRSTAVAGGDINRAWRLSDGRKTYFVKTNRTDRLSMFEAEQFGLEKIKRSQAIRVPEVYGCGTEGEHSFILMEYLQLGGHIRPELLAQQLAAMHLITQDQFGFPIDNTIGSTAQINQYSPGWIEFWQVNRLGYQLELGKENRLDREMVGRGEKLNDVVSHFFSDYQPVASLLHGDLWSGNQAADSQGNPVIFDPACYYGDHEADLAMMELFGHPGRDFFDAYADIFPLHNGYPVRRDLYNLYHILNHANLFGAGYPSSARRLIDKLLAQA